MLPTACLPFELLHDIIQLVNHKKTVLTCALVCRAWVAASRDIAFSETVALIQFSDSPHILNPFVTLIGDSRCTFREFIKRISICRTSNGTLYEQVMNALIQHAPQLEEITLYWTPAKPVAQLSPALRLLESTRSTIRQLNVLHFHPEDLLALLQVVSEAQNLTQVKIAVLAPMPEHLAFPSPPPSLLNVTTNLAARSFVESWMLKSRTLHDFEVFSADGPAVQELVECLSEYTVVGRSILSLKPILSCSSDYEPIRAFLHSAPCAQRLVRLTLDLSYYAESTDLDMSLTTNLQSITVHFVPTHSLTTGYNVNKARLDIILRTMSSMPVVILAAVRIDLFIHSDRRPDSRFVKQMDELAHGWATSLLELNTRFVTITVSDRHLSDGHGDHGYPLCRTLSQAFEGFALKIAFKPRPY